MYTGLMKDCTLTLCLCQHREMPLRLPIKHYSFRIKHRLKALFLCVSVLKQLCQNVLYSCVESFYSSRLRVFNFVEVLRGSDIRVMPIYPFYLFPFTFYLIEPSSINGDLGGIRINYRRRGG